MVQEAILSGTLQSAGKPVEAAKICILEQHGPALIACGRTDDLGEYAISVPLGTYRAEIQTAEGKVYLSTVSLREPGYHRDLLSVGEKAR